MVKFNKRPENVIVVMTLIIIDDVRFNDVIRLQIRSQIRVQIRVQIRSQIRSQIPSHAKCDTLVCAYIWRQI